MATASSTNRPRTKHNDYRSYWVSHLRGLFWLSVGVGLAIWVMIQPGSKNIHSNTSYSRPINFALSSESESTSGVVKRKIASIALGNRVLGRNPLREEVDPTYAEPDPAFWRAIRLQMKKPNHKLLWIELLRPLTWIESVGATPGAMIYLELHEFGAVGDALVTHVAPCPKIKPGKGTIVTGRFIHESDGNNVVELNLEGQSEATRVTANHRYWSVDRQQFVPVGKMRKRERVDAVNSTCCVASVRSLPYDGLLYNLETSEHVFRVGSVGTLVHNTCLASYCQMLGSDCSRSGGVLQDSIDELLAFQ